MAKRTSDTGVPDGSAKPAATTEEELPSTPVILPGGASDPKATVSLPAQLLDHAPPMYLARADGRLVFTNPAFRVLATALFEDSPVRPEAGAGPELRAIFDRLTSLGDDIVLRHSVTIGGELRHYRARHFRLTLEDGSPGFGGVYSDISREAQALIAAAEVESRFEDVIRSSSDWVWETDANLNLTYVSDRITEALETLPRTLIGRSLFVLGEFENAPGTSPMQDRMLRDFQPFRARPFLIRDASGGTRRVHLSGVPVFDHSTGSFVGYRGTGTDITEQHRAAEDLRRYQMRLQESLTELRDRNVQLDLALIEAQKAANAKTEFLGKMSHELRTPLNAIIGFSEMASQKVFGSLNDHYRSYFVDIHSAAKHLLTIINDILDAVSLEANRLIVRPEPTDCAELVADAKSLVQVRADRGNVDISAVQLPAGLTVFADPDRLRQILVNLINNAVKFTPPGGRIGVEAHEDGDNVELTVWDTGIGIPEDQLEAVFESFHQVDSNLMSKPQEGTGLGLSVSRQFARLMHGDIRAESTVGQGSRFIIRLPRSAPEKTPETP